jgi:hypothetical protein
MGKLQITNGECRNLECFGVCTIFQYIIRLALVIPAIYLCVMKSLNKFDML